MRTPLALSMRFRHNIAMNDVNFKRELTSILDSSLITATLYNIKVVDCGSYSQVYIYEDKVIKKRKEKNPELELKKYKVTQMVEEKNNNTYKTLNVIELKNVIRSKLECQRIAKANMEEWQTFITLTFKENIKDITSANKRFKYFVDKVRRVKKDFKYLCIPEFQKRGAVHYHLLTNVSINDKTLIYEQKDKKYFKHIKYWDEGHDKVDVVKGDVKKVVGYISKYMTKDIDNRLFSHRRYLYSQNLKHPKVNYINTDNDLDMNFYKKIIQDKNLIYTNEYVNPYDNNKVFFLEYLNK